MNKMTPFLWFDGRVAEAMDHYRSVFPAAKILSTVRHLRARRPAVHCLRRRPQHKLSPAVSMYINCETQAEVDDLWAKLTDGGAEGQCGWLVDRFGLSWQIIPSILPKLLGDPDRARAGRAMQAMFGMKKIDIAALERAAG